MPSRGVIPDIGALEQRAAIMHYEGGLSRGQAEGRAAQAQSFRDADHYWQVLSDYVVTRKLRCSPFLGQYLAHSKL